MANADILDQTNSNTPKWTRVYAKVGRATADFGGTPESFSVNYIGYRQMLGKFSYGAQFGYLYAGHDKIQTLAVLMGLRTDWDLPVQPTLDLSFGTTSLSSSASDKTGQGTLSSIGIGFDLFKGAFYSTSVSVDEVYLRSDAQAVRSATFQSVNFCFNLDFY